MPQRISLQEAANHRMQLPHPIVDDSSCAIMPQPLMPDDP
jgi:hypothetical protein